jgi:hypothetical protein
VFERTGRVLKLQLRFPASASNAAAHAALAVQAVQQEFEEELDYSPGSLETLDSQIEALREEGWSAEDAAELLFVVGCYVGEVFVRSLRGVWAQTAQSPLAGVSPWPMVVLLPNGSAWDAIGKTYLRFEIGDSEYLPAYFASAAASARR